MNIWQLLTAIFYLISNFHSIKKKYCLWYMRTQISFIWNYYSFIYITPENNASLQNRSCRITNKKFIKTDTWHVKSKDLLQPNTSGSKHHPRPLQILPASYCRPPWKFYSLRSLYCFCQLLWQKHSIVMMVELQNAILLIHVIYQLYIYCCINW